MKDHIILKAKQEEIRTDIYICSDVIENPHFEKLSQKLAPRYAVITDTNIGKLYGPSLIKFLKDLGLSATLHLFSAGEKSKSRTVKAALEDELFEAGHGRESAFIAMGGGVTTDLVGFIAATFCRGVPYISLPTSLLAMVDASVGSKTGINVSFGKNLIGATYSPQAIFLDLSVLRTLSDEGMREGTAEIIKHGLIARRSLFEMIDECIDKWNERDIPFLKKLIYESCHVKKKIVETDLKEHGMRRMLNFGHTIAHAIENIENYKMPHGEAVALGMVVESLISLKMKKIKESEFDEIYQLLKSMNYNLSISEKVTTEKMLEVMKYDKKAKGRVPRFVILEGIGKVEPFKGAYCTPVDDSLLSEALGWMVAEFYRPSRG